MVMVPQSRERRKIVSYVLQMPSHLPLSSLQTHDDQVCPLSVASNRDEDERNGYRAISEYTSPAESPTHIDKKKES